MIDSISGEVVRIDPDSVVIDTGGIAYAAFCPAGTIRSCSEGKTALLYTHLIARDDSVQLYGFSSPAERELFRQLLTVGQVGPRLAAFVKAIGSGDIASLTKIKGIGRKTAERILVDLRDKVGPGGGEASRFILSSEEETALKALTSKSLGFSPREARMALERKMRLLGIDYGRKRLGLALSDEGGILASPLPARIRSRSETDDIAFLKDLTRERGVERIVVGLPLNMDGSSGEMAEEALRFAALLEGEIGIPVATIDERLTSVEADRVLIEGGFSRQRRKGLRDSLAAVLILQAYLDRLRTGPD